MSVQTQLWLLVCLLFTLLVVAWSRLEGQESVYVQCLCTPTAIYGPMRDTHDGYFCSIRVPKGGALAPMDMPCYTINGRQPLPFGLR